MEDLNGYLSKMTEMQSYLFSQKCCFLPHCFKKIKSLCNLHRQRVTAEFPSLFVVFATCFANKLKGPRFNAFQNWKTKFLTPWHFFFYLPFCPLLSLSVSPATIISFSEWGTALFLLYKSFWETFLALFLCHTFFFFMTLFLVT